MVQHLFRLLSKERCCREERSFRWDKVKNEAVPAGERKVEAGAGRRIPRAVQWTVCCWKTGQLLQIIISVKKSERKRPHLIGWRNYICSCEFVQFKLHGKGKAVVSMLITERLQGIFLLSFAGIKSDRTQQLTVPVCRERGERGLDSVGEGVPTPRLFLLLLRQLKRKNTKSSDRDHKAHRFHYPSLWNTDVCGKIAR